MSKIRCEVYVQMIWHTADNQPLLHGELEAFVHQKIREAARDLGLKPLAVNSAWDHTHSLYKWHPPVSFSEAAKTIKSKACTAWLQRCKARGESSDFRWQGGGSAWSVRPEDVPDVVEYINGQKRRHADNRPDGIYEWQATMGEGRDD